MMVLKYQIADNKAEIINKLNNNNNNPYRYNKMINNINKLINIINKMKMIKDLLNRVAKYL